MLQWLKNSNRRNAGLQVPVPERNPASKTGIKNVVLVHGAFADGSGWEAVAKILEKDGYTVSVAQPPETSYAEDIKYTKAAVDAMDGPVVLVGHSYGGSIITEAGNDPKVSALVYIAAFELDDGESCASIEQALPQASKAFKPDSDGNWWIEQAHFAADFAADVPPAVSHFMAESQVPISTESFTHKVTKARLEDQAQLVHGGHRRPVDQSGTGAHDREARPCHDGTTTPARVTLPAARCGRGTFHPETDDDVIFHSALLMNCPETSGLLIGR